MEPDSVVLTSEENILVSYLDFIVGCNGKILFDPSTRDSDSNSSAVDLMELVQSHVSAQIGQEVKEPIEFLVYNIKSRTSRTLYFPIPDDASKFRLGLHLWLDDYSEGASYRMVRCLSVDEDPHSPAAVAGLRSGSDYLLGTRNVSFDSVDTLVYVLNEAEQNKESVSIYTYNSETDYVRLVSLLPTYDRGGKLSTSLIGMEVGFGLLHRIPPHCRETDGKSVPPKRILTVPNTIQSLHEKDESTQGNIPEHESNRGNLEYNEKETPHLAKVSSEGQLISKPNAEIADGSNVPLSRITTNALTEVNNTEEKIINPVSSEQDRLFTQHCQVGTSIVSGEKKEMALVDNDCQEEYDDEGFNFSRPLDNYNDGKSIETGEVETNKCSDQGVEEDDEYNEEAFSLISPLEPLVPFPIIPPLSRKPSDEDAFESFPPPPKINSYAHDI